MKIAKDLRGKLQASPEAEVNLIIRVKDDPAAQADRLSQAGLKVRHIFRLTRALAITGRAKDCLALAAEPWVEAIEEDRKVKAL